MTAGTREAGGTDLSWLLAGVVSTPAVMIRDLTLDSRTVAAGDAFVAVGGRATHGLDHAADAIARAEAPQGAARTGKGAVNASFSGAKQAESLHSW